jgi:hypothetical protein
VIPKYLNCVEKSGGAQAIRNKWEQTNANVNGINGYTNGYNNNYVSNSNANGYITTSNVNTVNGGRS